MSPPPYVRERMSPLYVREVTQDRGRKLDTICSPNIEGGGGGQVSQPPQTSYEQIG